MRVVALSSCSRLSMTLAFNELVAGILALRIDGPLCAAGAGMLLPILISENRYSLFMSLKL